VTRMLEKDQTPGLHVGRVKEYLEKVGPL
jgi:hypothetical protein